MQCKPYFSAFLVGGIFAVCGQLLLMLSEAILGADSPFLISLVLLGMGIIALLTYIPGVYQRISAWGGWGAMMPFNGFACAVADAYEGAAKEGGGKAGVKAGLDVVLWVIGTGTMISIVIAATAHFMG